MEDTIGVLIEVGHDDRAAGEGPGEEESVLRYFLWYIDERRGTGCQRTAVVPKIICPNCVGAFFGTVIFDLECASSLIVKVVADKLKVTLVGYTTGFQCEGGGEHIVGTNGCCQRVRRRRGQKCLRILYKVLDGRVSAIRKADQLDTGRKLKPKPSPVSHNESEFDKCFNKGFYTKPTLKCADWSIYLSFQNEEKTRVQG